MEKGGNRAESAGQEAAYAAAQSKETNNEGASREEESDELKGEHEARFQIVFVRTRADIISALPIDYVYEMAYCWTREAGTPVVVPKFLLGSKAYAGCTCGQTLRPLVSPHVFQKVHLEVPGAPGMAEVSASRK